MCMQRNSDIYFYVHDVVSDLIVKNVIQNKEYENG